MKQLVDSLLLLSLLLVGELYAKEQLVRRRDLSEDAIPWVNPEATAQERSEESFVRAGDWGKYSKAGYSKGNKGIKGTKHGKGSKGAKGYKGSKGGYGMEASPVYHPYYSPHYAPYHSPYASHPKPAPYAPPTKPMKSPTKPLQPYGKPPYSSPTKPPQPYGKPSPPTSKCPDVEYNFCNPDPHVDSCDVHTSCGTGCFPKHCKIPENPHKIHAHGGSKDDRFVKLGDVCGWMDYVEGFPRPRHDYEVCCDTAETEDDPYYAACGICGSCIYPQKVNSACCVDAVDGAYDRMERAGDFGGCPDPKYPICCKCGVGKYKCIGPNDHCQSCEPELGSISGSVKDTNGDPLIDVLISLYLDPVGGELGSPIKTTLTDGSGNYLFTGLPPGKYLIVETDPPGYKSVADFDNEAEGDNDGESDRTVDNMIISTLNEGEDDVGNDFIDMEALVCKVFVSSTTQDGNLGGIQGADALCQALIDDADPPYASTKVWKAWLSTTDGSGTTYYSPQTNFVRCDSYELLNDTPVAISWEDLTNGDIANAIDLDENRNIVSTPSPTTNADTVWTGTAIDGSPANDANCNNWSSGFDGDQGQWGLLDQETSDWTSASSPQQGCSASRRIYCFEDEPDPSNASITGSVLDDSDGTGIPDVTILLERPDGSQVRTTETDANGQYEFNMLPTGRFIIREIDPTGYMSVEDFDTDPEGDEDGERDTAADNMIISTLFAGEKDAGNDFVDRRASIELGTISGSVRADAIDGSPIPGVLITLQRLDGSTADMTTVTNESGEYEFNNLNPGDYVLVETDPDGFDSVTDYDTTPDGDNGETDPEGDNRINVTLDAGELKDDGNVFVDERELGTISGTVQDTEDNPLVDVLITLRLRSDESVDFKTTLTDVAGFYEFTDVPEGAYVVVETDPQGYGSVTDFDTEEEGDNDGEEDTDGDNRINVTQGAGEDDVGNDFVDGLLGSIVGTVREDTINGDALTGVLITLRRRSDDSIVGTAETDSLGDFEFDNVIPGDYVLVETDPVGFDSVTDYDTTPEDDDNGETDPTGDNRINVTVDPGEDDENNTFVDRRLRCGTVVISEFLYDPLGPAGDLDGEWVELFNHGCESIDLKRWYFGNRDRRARITSAYGTTDLTLPPKEYAVIVDNNAVNRSATMLDFVDDLLEREILVLRSPYVFIGTRLVDGAPLNNTGIDMGSDEVIIADENNIVQDIVRFNTDDCPAPQGVSLERIESLGPSDCSNLEASQSAGGSSPGRVNANWKETVCECGKNPDPVLPSVIITEVYFNPPGGPEDGQPKSDEYPDEWIELNNNDCGPVDIANWSLGDTSLAGGLTPVPETASTILSPGERVILIPFLTDATPFLVDGVRVFKVGMGNSLGSGLNNANDRIYIYNENREIIDTMEYSCEDDRINCPTDFEEGKTIERTNALDAESFVTSEGTPGIAIDGFQNALAGCDEGLA